MASNIISIFGSTGVIPLPPTVPGIIADYLYFFPKFCDLSDKKVLEQYVMPGTVKKALEIAQQIYQKSRSVSDNNYGLVFPADAEILGYAMQKVKAEKDMEVCELACASGENGILLAYAGAKQVTFNDITERELENLRLLMGFQGASISKKCQIVGGSALNVLQRSPTLKGRMGLVLCRNLLHFLRTPEQVQLLRTVKDLLRPDGQAIFVANSIYSRGVEMGGSLEQSPTSSYRVRLCLLFNRNLPSHIPGKTLCAEWTPCEDALVSVSSCTTTYLYEKDQETNYKWKKNLNNWKTFDKAFQGNITTALDQEKAQLAQIKRGAIRVTTSHVRLYNPVSLAHLFRSNGFEVISEFFVDNSGHTVDFAERFKARAIGVIVTKK